ncbi:MAG: hypothetical protein PF448_10805 [Bacteroidales bacterium]|jgi:hypothetical protein|nr:hypothetical protein [Bacteroidales bacterium]
MKRVFIILVFLFSCSIVISQTSDVRFAPVKGFSIYKEDASIDVNEVDENLYISMVTGNEVADGFYTFERSFDGENYVILSKRTFHNGSESDAHLFTFVSKLPVESAQYRIYKFTSEAVTLMKEYSFEPDYIQVAIADN